MTYQDGAGEGEGGGLGHAGGAAKKKQEGRVMTTSSVRIDERDGRGEVTIMFVSTVGDVEEARAVEQ